MAIVHYRPMFPEDFDALYELWTTTPGVDVTRGDTADGLHCFLDRNPGLSFVAESGGQVIGAIMCGHDGRRGFIHHLVVYLPFQRQGIATTLVARSLSALASKNIEKCHLFIRKDNHAGMLFWKNSGWQERIELSMASYTL